MELANVFPTLDEMIEWVGSKPDDWKGNVVSMDH